jgi:hypothetical protein
MDIPARIALKNTIRQNDKGDKPIGYCGASYPTTDWNRRAIRSINLGKFNTRLMSFGVSTHLNQHKKRHHPTGRTSGHGDHGLHLAVASRPNETRLLRRTAPTRTALNESPQ